MGNCLKSKNQVKINEIIISVVGLDDAGKSTLAKVLKGDKDLVDVVPTGGYEPYEFQYNGRDLKVYDLGGGSRVRDIWKHYFAESFGFVFVIDASDRSRINECRNVFASFIENPKCAGKPVLILANKQDASVNAMDESEIVQFLNVEELVNKYEIPCRIESCAALKGSGKNADAPLKVGFDWLMKHLVVNYEELKTRIDQDVQVQKGEESRIRRDKSDRVRKSRSLRDTNDYDQDDDQDEDSNISPWKALTDLKNKDKSKSNNSSLTSNDRQMLEDMRVSSPKPNSRLTTIDEEKSKLRNRFLKSNKLNPYDDNSGSTAAIPSRNTSWAITDHTPPKRGLPSLDKPIRGRYES